jgi:hypothetical protein
MTPQDAFEFVRKEFFPRWDTKGLWSLVPTDAPPHYSSGEYIFGGYCDTDLKEIGFRSDLEGPALEQVLIHEICHAVSGMNTHGKKFQERLGRAAVTARSKGVVELVRLIEQDLNAMRDINLRLLKREVYQAIRYHFR